MEKLFAWLEKEESGQGMVEYGLIIAAIAVVAIVTLTPLGGLVAGMFTTIGASLT
ncbi:Flp family type IVb pilin [Anaerotignum sp.]|jgi:pilus assembly protein Flp/PilA|uniref:Flp family type IVb pilin n=1 Tax=Anaerotignum sp. TaxID=2039241 RepID=UPI002714ADB9|nr:Flp family type IVb pilin [Anaerotignum sp.]